VLLPAAALACAACAGASLRTPQPGEPLRTGETVVVGSVVAIPPFEQIGPRPGAVSLGGAKGSVLAYFSDDLAEGWNNSPTGSPLSRAETALVPLDGPFFFVVPRPGTIFLRGLLVPTDAGSEKLQVSLRLDVRPGERVVYVGAIKLIRTGDRRILVRDDQRAARGSASALGLEQLAGAPWIRRLAEAP
jgi:hypothetical protein